MSLNEAREIEIEEIFKGDAREVFTNWARATNLGDEHSIYQKILHLMAYISVVCPNILIFSFGEENMGKSYLYTNILKLDKIGEFPTKADWRGAKNGNGSAEPLLSKKFLLLEEIKDNSISEDDLGILKEAITSKKFTVKDEIKDTEISIVMIFNDYSQINKIEDLRIEKIKQVLPPPLRDNAMWSRIKIFLPFYRGLIGEIDFKPTLKIDEKKLEEYFFSLRKLEIVDEETKIDEIKRKKENILEVYYGFIKILCPGKKLSEVSLEVKEATIDIVRHFMALGEGEFKPLITDKTMKLIAKFQGIEVSEQAFFYKLSESRFLIEDRKEKVAIVSAVDYSGCLKNKEVVECLKKTPEHFLDFIIQKNNFQILKFKLDNSIQNIRNIRQDNWEIHKKTEKFKTELIENKRKIFQLIIQKLAKSISNFYSTNNIIKSQEIEYILKYGITDQNIAFLNLYPVSYSYMSCTSFYCNCYEKEKLVRLFMDYMETKIKNFVFERDVTSIKKILKKFDEFIDEKFWELRNFIEFRYNGMEEIELIPDLELNGEVINDDMRKLILLKMKINLGREIEENLIFYINKNNLEPKIIGF